MLTANAAHSVLNAAVVKLQILSGLILYKWFIY